MALALVETLLDEFLRAGQMHEEGGNVLGEHLTVAALQGGAGDHGVLVQRLASHHPGVDDLEPRPTVLVCQRNACAHLVDVGLRMEVVALRVHVSETFVNGFCHGGFAASCNTHHHYVNAHVVLLELCCIASATSHRR